MKDRIQRFFKKVNACEEREDMRMVEVFRQKSTADLVRKRNAFFNRHLTLFFGLILTGLVLSLLVIDLSIELESIWAINMPIFIWAFYELLQRRRRALLYVLREREED